MNFEFIPLLLQQRVLAGHEPDMASTGLGLLVTSGANGGIRRGDRTSGAPDLH
jgi:hypothetical protein